MDTEKKVDVYSCMGIFILNQVSLDPKDAKCVSAKQNAQKNHSAEFCQVFDRLEFIFSIKTLE